MMSRRIRIKAIANIPIRRKAETATEDTSIKNGASESTEAVNDVQPNENISEETEKKNNENDSPKSEESPTEIVESQDEIVTQSLENEQENENQSLEKCDKTEISEQVPDNNKENKVVIEPRIIRRLTQKPVVRIPARKPKNLEKESIDNTNNNSETHIETSVIKPAEEIEKPVAEPVHTEPNISEENTIPETEPTKIQPLSPSKIVNRARIKPVPKLIRRNSIQGNTSESEDDARKIVSQNNETPTKNKPLAERIKHCVAHKKFQRSEQSRKLLDAKKDFFRKYGSKQPDKKRLTMFDLIYYNPVTNPMPPKETRSHVNSEPIVKIIQNESVDDPDEPKTEEDITPVPQVKVGPNGEIILDEKSLVIEQTGAKQGRDDLANSQIVIDDDKSYGIYKRNPRTKEWPARETLRFYKALNTVGTDFSLMVSLFPGRSRRDLKMKFKKEERLNRHLVDKCLMNPLHFDLSELETQLQYDIRTQSEAPEKSAEKPRLKRRKRKKQSALARDLSGEETVRKSVTLPKPERDMYSYLENSLDAVLESDLEEYVPNKIQKVESHENRPQRQCRLKPKFDFVKLLADSDEDESNSNEASKLFQDQETEEIEAEETEEIEAEETSTNQEISNGFEITGKELVLASELPPPEEPRISPPTQTGSIMIVSTEGEKGESIYKVFMVTPSNDNNPVAVMDSYPPGLTDNNGGLLALPPSTPCDSEPV